MGLQHERKRVGSAAGVESEAVFNQAEEGWGRESTRRHLMYMPVVAIASVISRLDVLET